MRNRPKRKLVSPDLGQWATLLADAVRREPAHPDAKTDIELAALMNTSRQNAIRTAKRMVKEGKLREIKDWRKSARGSTILAIVYQPL